ncbi:hypothetical protein KDY119_00368 [Luteimicrobium xylanilyticum]|uniref:Uncharacterized protein n=1 Tax=Luteimicrobium xylanilyticum TaxID=1133546 RepID=A0A5P9Q655_9MICO|nr:hypothetical protein [Luteimicrobium xylanilyticum]QFU96878.1 hypothetical protein KDY119_00368 [Luteimicrobium xylanilyticum]
MPRHQVVAGLLVDDGAVLLADSHLLPTVERILAGAPRVPRS